MHTCPSCRARVAKAAYANSRSDMLENLEYGNPRHDARLQARVDYWERWLLDHDIDPDEALLASAAAFAEVIDLLT